MRDTHAQKPQHDQGLPIVSPTELVTLFVELNCTRRKPTGNPHHELELLCASRDDYRIRVYLLKRSESRIADSGACSHIVPSLATERQSDGTPGPLGTNIYYSTRFSRNHCCLISTTP